VLERDYGCGNPAEHLRRGERVLDLGSGTGKICFIAAQVVGEAGHVIGVDMTGEMLAVARRAAPIVAERLGFANTTFLRGRIQDLALDVEALDAHLSAHPVRSAEDLARLDAKIARLRRDSPLVQDESVDVVVSNCVLNLVSPGEKAALFSEIHRVLRRGGRAVISDIVSDEVIPEALQRDPELWSGCVSGALREDHFLRAFEDAGFYGVTLHERQSEPWRIVDGIELRSVTVIAYKGKEGPCLDQKHAVVYRGPFRQVEDDDGHVLRRGDRMAVCAKTFEIYTREPYRQHFEPIEPATPVPIEEAPAFPCGKPGLLRDPSETKLGKSRVTTAPSDACCDPEGKCC
jgi:arsenite methyltransferase